MSIYHERAIGKMCHVSIERQYAFLCLGSACMSWPKCSKAWEGMSQENDEMQMIGKPKGVILDESIAELSQSSKEA